MKTSELTGAALDWAVVKTLGDAHNRDFIIRDGLVYATQAAYNLRVPFAPSSNWCQGGPIIERECICLWTEGYDWEAKQYGEHIVWGETPLIAAMRCYVASKLGDEVEIPEELK